jgi:hypothetical protein
MIANMTELAVVLDNHFIIALCTTEAGAWKSVTA